MTTTAVAAMSAPEIIRAAVATIRVRGRYQPSTRPEEAEPPTTAIVRDYLTGRDVHDHGTTRRALDAAAAQGADETAAVLAWCRAGADKPPETYRGALAVAVARETIGDRERALLCSAAGHYLRERDQARRVVARTAERADEAARSRYQAAPGQRITRALTVTAVRPLGDTYRPRTLLRLRDADGHVYLWRTTAETPQHGQHITLTGTVSQHHPYTDRRTGDVIQQTHMSRCRWNPADADE